MHLSSGRWKWAELADSTLGYKTALDPPSCWKAQLLPLTSTQWTCHNRTALHADRAQKASRAKESPPGSHGGSRIRPSGSARRLNDPSSQHGLRRLHRGSSCAPAQTTGSPAGWPAGAATQVHPARWRSGGQNQPGGQLHHQRIPDQICPHCIWRLLW